MPTPYDYKTWSVQDYFRYKKEVECYRKIAKKAQGFDRFSEEEVDRYKHLTKLLDDELAKFERTTGKEVNLKELEKTLPKTERKSQKKIYLNSAGQLPNKPAVQNIPAAQNVSENVSSQMAFRAEEPAQNTQNKVMLSGMPKQAAPQNNVQSEQKPTPAKTGFFTLKLSK